jgi:hypothetical protein
LSAPSPLLYKFTADVLDYEIESDRVAQVLKRRSEVTLARLVEAKDRGDFLMAVLGWLAEAFSGGLMEMRLGVRASRDDRGNPLLQPVDSGGHTLMDVCCLHLSTQLIDRREIRICQDDVCHSPFKVDDRRQRFCSDTCASRFRKRRLRHQARHATVRNRRSN